jgi:hypothetical protein
MQPAGPIAATTHWAQVAQLHARAAGCFDLDAVDGVGGYGERSAAEALDLSDKGVEAVLAAATRATTAPSWASSRAVAQPMPLQQLDGVAPTANRAGGSSRAARPRWSRWCGRCAPPTGSRRCRDGCERKRPLRTRCPPHQAHCGGCAARIAPASVGDSGPALFRHCVASASGHVAGVQIDADPGGGA